LTAIGARIFFLVYIDEPTLFIKYPFFAEKLARGVDIGERLADLSPFYLYCLTFLKKVFGVDWTFVKFIHSLVGALNCLLLYAVGSRAFRKEVGFLAALIFSLYGNLIILESTLEPTVFVLLFNLLSVYFLIRANDDSTSPIPRRTISLMAGLFVGLSIITKPSFLLFLPLAAIWLIFCVRGALTFRQRLSSALFFCTAALLVVVPVTVRNFVKLHDFVLVTADGGKVFYHGNGRGATALAGTGLPDEGFAQEGADEPDYAHVLFRKTADRLSGKRLSPSESSRFWVRRALSDILSDPASYIKLEAKKLFYFFNNYEMHYIASAYKEYKASLSFPFIRYGIIASLGFLGMVLATRHFKELSLVYVVVLVYLLSGMLFLVQSRYRTPAVPYLCLFAGHAVFALKLMVGAKRFKTATVGLILLGVFFFLTNFFHRDEILGVDRWQQATKIHYEMGGQPLFQGGKYQEAVTELDKCIAMAPNFSPAYNLRGKAYAVLGRHKEALDDFKQVVTLSPGVSKGFRNLGFLYLLQGDTQVARDYLSKALRLAPHDTKVKEALAKSGKE
jgi:tetratricopeptide (TPR) repeat protein